MRKGKGIMAMMSAEERQAFIEEHYDLSVTYDAPPEDELQHSECHFDEDNEMVTGLSDEQRRQKRVDLCGRVHVNSLSPKTGMLTSMIFYCHEFRVCPICKKVRMTEVSSALTMLAYDSGGKLVYSKLDEEKATALRKKLSAENYKSYPMSDGDCFLIFDPKVEGKEVNAEDYGAKQFLPNILKEVDMEKIAITPKGKCISGKVAKKFEERKIAKSPPAPSEEESVTVYVEEIHTDQSDSEPIWKEAWRLTLVDTHDFDPQTEEDLQKCVNRRLEAFKKHYIDLGGNVFFIITKKMKVKLSQINWQMALKYLDLSEENGFSPPVKRKAA